MNTIVLFAIVVILSLLAIASIVDKIDILYGIVISIVMGLVLYEIGTVVLVVIHSFSVNKALFLANAIAGVVVLIVLLTGRRPSASFSAQKNLIPMIIALIVIATGLVLTDNGYFGIEDTLGKYQTQAMWITQGYNSDLSEDLYLTASMDEQSTDVASDVLESVQSQLPESGTNGSFFAALLALSENLCGYQEMMAVIPVCAGLFLYLLYGLLLYTKKVHTSVNALICAIGGACIIAVLFGTIYKRQTVITWDQLSELESVITPYDAVLIDDDIAADLYVPLKCIATSYTAPTAGTVADAVDRVENRVAMGISPGEKLYYITQQTLDEQTLQQSGSELNLISSGTYQLYEKDSLYVSRYEPSTADFYQRIGILIAFLAGTTLGAISLSRWSKKLTGETMDTAIAAFMGCGIFALCFAAIGLVLKAIGLFSIPTALATDVAFFVVISLTTETVLETSPLKRSYHTKQIVGLVSLLVGIVLLSCLVEWPQVISGYGNNPFYDLSEALFGQERVIFAYPIAVFSVVSVVYGVISMVRRWNRHVFAMTLPVAMIGMVLSITGATRFHQICTYEQLETYTDTITSADAVAVDANVTPGLAEKIQEDTKAQVYEVSDYETVEATLAGKGNLTYFLTKESLDTEALRLITRCDDGNTRLYQTNDRRQSQLIYSAEDSLIQGLYETEVDGSAWTNATTLSIITNLTQQDYVARLYFKEPIPESSLDLDETPLNIALIVNDQVVGVDTVSHENNGSWIEYQLPAGYLSEGVNEVSLIADMQWKLPTTEMLTSYSFGYLQLIPTGTDAE